MLRSTGNAFILKQLGLVKVNTGHGPSKDTGFFIFHKVMLHKTIHNDDFWRNTASQHCCDAVSNSCNIVPTLQRSGALKIIIANRPV